MEGMDVRNIMNKMSRANVEVYKNQNHVEDVLKTKLGENNQE